jgi:hypothetical protein
MQSLAIIAFTLLIAGGFFAWMLDDQVLSRLRTSHPDIWEALGPPTKAFDDWGMERTKAVEEFCRRPEFRSQCDDKVVKLARFARRYHRVYAVVAGMAVLALGWAVWWDK